jgi:hypothetical protein
MKPLMIKFMIIKILYEFDNVFISFFCYVNTDNRFINNLVIYITNVTWKIVTEIVH